MLAAAAAQAEKLLSEARARAAEQERQIIVRGEKNAATILEDAEKQAEELKREAILKSKEEVAKLIVLGMEQLAKK